MECISVFDFYPAPESVNLRQLVIEAPGLAYLDYDDSGVASPVPALGEGGEKCNLKSIVNYSFEPFSGYIRLVLKDKTGKNKATSELCDVSFDPYNGWYGWSVFPITFDVPYAFGDYVEFEFAAGDPPQQWSPLDPYECRPSQIVTELPVYPAAFIAVEGYYGQNDWFALELMNNAEPYDGTVWTFTDPDDNTVTINQSEMEIQLTKKGTWKVQAAVAPAEGDPVTETIVTYIKVY